MEFKNCTFNEYSVEGYSRDGEKLEYTGTHVSTVEDDAHHFYDLNKIRFLVLLT